jgi:hypothetical protein
MIDEPESSWLKGPLPELDQAPVAPRFPIVYESSLGFPTGGGDGYLFWSFYQRTGNTTRLGTRHAHPSQETANCYAAIHPVSFQAAAPGHGVRLIRTTRAGGKSWGSNGNRVR